MGIVCKNTNFLGSEMDFPQGKETGCTKTKTKRRNTGFSSAPNICETYIARSHTAIACLGHVIVNLLLLLWAGDRLECSHSYMILCFVLAKKK